MEDSRNEWNNTMTLGKEVCEQCSLFTSIHVKEGNEDESLMCLGSEGKRQVNDACKREVVGQQGRRIRQESRERRV